MTATGFLSDDVIEAIVDDRPVDPSWAALVTFAREVRALGEDADPRPSNELAVLLAGSRTAPDADVAITAPLPVVAASDPTDRVGGRHLAGVNGTSRSHRSTTLTDPTERVATLGARRVGRRRVAKVALGVAVAAVGVAGAGAVGILPAAANDAVRSAIEAVSPVQFADPGDAPADIDDRSPEPPTSDQDETGDTTTTADDAPGTSRPPSSSAPDEPPGQSGDTGLDRADETPAAPHTPDSTPVSTPAVTAPRQADKADEGAPESVPSTVPTSGGPTDDHGSDT